MMFKKFSGAIFDMDGTLLDSMWLWRHSGSLLFKQLGLTPPADIQEILAPMDLPEMTKFIRDTYDSSLTHEKIIDELNQLLFTEYNEHISLKPGVLEKLQEFHHRGIKMCIATATDLVHVKAALRRLKIDHYFQFIITSTEIGNSKREPQIFREALRRLGTPKDETVIFEDARYALKTAKADHFFVAAVYDKYAALTPEEIHQYSDWYLQTLTDWKE